jgi:multicomponent Na+:H+ antiporter subunit C
MEFLLAPVAGLLVAVAVWLMLAGDLVRFLLGLAMMSNGVNLAIFLAGRLSWAAPPLIAAGASAPDPNVANALPQALVLTAIVIGFGLFCFMLALVFRARGTP